MGIADVHESGTATGVLYRAWADLKAALGGGDRTMLATAEQGEDEAKAAYKDALAKELPLPLRQLLTAQEMRLLPRMNLFVRSAMRRTRHNYQPTEFESQAAL